MEGEKLFMRLPKDMWVVLCQYLKKRDEINLFSTCKTIKQRANEVIYSKHTHFLKRLKEHRQQETNILLVTMRIILRSDKSGRGALWINSPVPLKNWVRFDITVLSKCGISSNPYIRYTLDGWKTWKQISGRCWGYQGDKLGTFYRFIFGCSKCSWIDSQFRSIEFAICCRNVWDNNEGQNYKMPFYIPTTPATLWDNPYIKEKIIKDVQQYGATGGCCYVKGCYWSEIA